LNINKILKENFKYGFISKINRSNIFGRMKKNDEKNNALMGIEPRHAARSPHAYHYTNRSSCQVLHSKSL
jgi:hypothetical protein